MVYGVQQVVGNFETTDEAQAKINEEIMKFENYGDVKGGEQPANWGRNEGEARWQFWYEALKS